MQKTKIEYCDYTWNPVTGCLHGCPYCYARAIAHRFKAKNKDYSRDVELKPLIHTVLEKGHPFPFGFEPTMYRYRLGEPAKLKGSQTIFVGSMCDLFANWVPYKWVEDVLNACAAAPQHRYLFLTKNPIRYIAALKTKGMPRMDRDNWYFGSAMTNAELFLSSPVINMFLNIEPLFDECNYIDLTNIVWVIIGAEIGNRKDKIIPKQKWIEAIIEQCQAVGIPVFMKNNLSPIWGKKLIQQYPWEV